MSDNIKEALLDIVKDLEDELSTLMHQIDEDDNVPRESWHEIDDASTSLFYLITLLREYLI